MDRQKLAQQHYSDLSFFLVPGLPRGSEAGVDGRVWTVDKFDVRPHQALPAPMAFY